MRVLYVYVRILAWLFRVKLEEPRTLTEWMESVFGHLAPSQQQRIRAEIETRMLKDGFQPENFLAWKKKTPGPLALTSGKPQNLAEWLQIAVGNLVPSAQARIRPEIDAHYAEAVQTYLASGKSETDAQATALADLGSAHTAARRFSRKHLTVGDIKTLTEQIKDARVRWLSSRSAKFDLIWRLLIVSLFIYFWLTDARTSNGYLIWALAILALVLVSAGLRIAAGRLARQKITLSVARQVHWLDRVKEFHSHVATLVYCVPGIWMMISGDDPVLPHFFRGLLTVAIGMIILGSVLGAIGERMANLSLRKKLAAASEDDLPPLDTSTN